MDRNKDTEGLLKENVNCYTGYLRLDAEEVERGERAVSMKSNDKRRS